MKRAYYDDPLKAAYMAKYFGMWFTRESYHITLCDILDSIYEADPAPCYIHPDSLHLLEPKNGDVIIINNGYHTPYAANYRLAPETRRSTIKRIIERDGKTFHWPVFETAESEAS